MRPLRALAIYLAVVFIGGALLAPWLYWLVQSFAHTFPGLASAPFHRYVNRALLILALAGLWPLFRALGIRSCRDAGLVKPSGPQFRNFGGGFLFGLVSLAIVATLAFVLGARDFNAKLTAGQIAGKLLGAAATAMVTSVLEEILFRGALFGGLRKVFHWTFALVVSSMVYAIVHYLESPKDPEAVTWLSGLQLLPGMLANFGNLQQVIPGFFNLTLAGMILGLAYQRTGTLYFPIGLHAGWIFWVKIYGIIARPAAGSSAWLWGSGRMAVVNGWAALPVLAGTLVVVWFLVKGKTSNIQ